MSDLSRRTVLGSATAIAASATLPALADQSQCSPEFQQWYALAKTTREVLDADEAWEKAHPFADDTSSSPYHQLMRALNDLEWKMCERPVRSWADVAELGIVALFWTESDVRPGEDEDPLAITSFALGRDVELESGLREERSRAYLIQAVAKLAMQHFGIVAEQDQGGAHGTPQSS